MSSGMEEILQIFFEEATQIIDELEQFFLGLGSGKSASPEDLKTMFRLAHNLKGSSKSIGMSQMGKVTHELETLLVRFGEGKISFSESMTSALLSTIDKLNEQLAAARETGSDSGDIDYVVSVLVSLQRGEIPPSTDSSSHADGDIIFISDSQPTPNNEDQSHVSQVSNVSQSEPVQATPNQSTPAQSTPNQSTPASGAANHNKAGNSNETVRVPTFRIDKLQNHVGEILVLQSVLSEQLRDHPSALVRNTLRQMKKVTREVQDGSMGLRLLPMKGLFAKLTRAVHDAATTLNKQVDFIISGEDTEIDKVLSEGLADPLMHMVRNAVDHGQESTEERVAAGKPAKGRVELSARCEGAFLTVVLRDDGKGLDQEAILAKARHKGLVTLKQELSPKEIFALIFLPGFSTKAVVSEVSGRGVGMDVVQTNIHAMRGHISIDSIANKGTTFTLSIPLAISLLDGMVLQIANEKWILPLHMVVQSFRLSACTISTLAGAGKVVTIRNENIPLIDLGSVLQVRSSPSTGGNSHHTSNSRPTSDSSSTTGSNSVSANSVVIVAKDKSTRVALIVEQVLGIQTVVNKPLTPEMQAKPGVSGCAILGDGKTSLILEISALYNNIQHGRRAA